MRTCYWPPHLLLAEAANVLLRKRRRDELSAQELRDLLRAINKLPIRLVEQGPLLEAACTLAETHGLTLYDALYLALAEQQGARLLTCDEQLNQVARHLGLL